MRSKNHKLITKKYIEFSTVFESNIRTDYKLMGTDTIPPKSFKEMFKVKNPTALISRSELSIGY